ncbi:hypothetical protein [Nostoc sp. FACHB-152]|uniref:hypothetical protein n=1 Tax=Nostoc sp. FACHB-152 TaxID=2692837 RepID=UPI0016886740|nr:hypothetical protein [Nostoc sp. FACHB-152]
MSPALREGCPPQATGVSDAGASPEGGSHATYFKSAELQYGSDKHFELRIGLGKRLKGKG